MVTVHVGLSRCVLTSDCRAKRALCFAVSGQAVERRWTCTTANNPSIFMSKSEHLHFTTDDPHSSAEGPPGGGGDAHPSRRSFLRSSLAARTLSATTTYARTYARTHACTHLHPPTHLPNKQQPAARISCATTPAYAP
ncbi:hypothetical protein PMIN04_011725 [Paraphaeosphaeria minitans]